MYNTLYYVPKLFDEKSTIDNYFFHVITKGLAKSSVIVNYHSSKYLNLTK